MKLHTFAQQVCLYEAGKKEVNIAQVKEILKVINRLLNGDLYKTIRKRMTIT